MPQTWFYAYEGTAHGPFSSEEISALVATGLLGAEEPVWPEGKDASEAIPAGTVGSPGPAEAALTLSPPVESSVPDWLSDVASLESSRAAAEQASETEIHDTETMDWLEDLRIWVGLDIHDAKQTAHVDRATAPAPAPPDGKVPMGKPASRGRKKKSRPVLSTAADAVPIALPVTSPAAEVPTGELEVPVPMIDTLAQQTLAETGFDFKTGRIVNPAKFKKWKLQKARSAEANQSDMTNASQLELFRRARTAIETWVADEKNRQRIIQASIEQIKANRQIQEVYTQYAGLGFRQKLEKYLEFLVKNRKKYHDAQTKTGG